jgi:hypothetical protein
VENTVREKAVPTAPAVPVVAPATSDWGAVESAVGGLEDYDFDAFRETRELEVRRADQALA